MDRNENKGVGEEAERFEGGESIEGQGEFTQEQNQNETEIPQVTKQERSVEAPMEKKPEQIAVETETSLKKGIQEAVRSEMHEVFLAASPDIHQQIKSTSGELLLDAEAILSEMDASNRSRQSDLLLERVHDFVKTLGAKEAYTVSSARNLTEALLDLSITPSQ